MNPDKKTFWRVDEAPHVPIFDLLGRLKKSLDTRNDRWRRFVGSLLNKPINGFKPSDLGETDLEVMRRARGVERRLALNPAENCIAALGARIASQRPRASFLTSTDGPDAWSVKQRALKLEKAVAGEWQRGKFYAKTRKVFMHAGAVGFGAMHVFPGGDRVRCEVVPPWELIVDEQAAINGETRTLLREKWIPLEVAIARFAGKGLPAKFREANRAALERCVSDTGAVTGGYKTITTLCRIVEAWHLPSGWGAEDGRHVICCAERTLTPESDWGWPHERFPFAFFNWSDPVIGFYPQGLIEREEPVQGQLNKLLARAQDAAHLYSVTNTYFEEGSIDKAHFKNSTGNLIPVKKGTRQMPVTTMPSAINTELIKLIYDLRGWVFEETGVSQMSAASVRPAGIESGRGLMVLRDTESGRHALLNEAWDDFHVDAAELTVIALRDLAEAGGDYSTHYAPARGRKIERIKWSEVDLDRDAYEIQVFPSSMLPHEPAGRFEQVEALKAGGYVSQAQAAALLRMPDLEQFASLDASSYEIVEWQIEKMLVGGESVLPRRYQDLASGLPIVTAALQRAEMQGAPRERLELLERWIEVADQYLAEAQGGDTAPPGPGGPQGAPEMPQGLPPGLLPPGLPPGPQGPG